MVKHSFYDDLITKQIYTDGFKCPHFEECSGSMEPNNKLKFYRTRIGSKYDEEQIKILVVGQEDVGEGKNILVVNLVQWKRQDITLII